MSSNTTSFERSKQYQCVSECAKFEVDYKNIQISI